VDSQRRNNNASDLIARNIDLADDRRPKMKGTFEKWSVHISEIVLTK